MRQLSEARRSRGLKRMSIAIDRGVEGRAGVQADRALRWVALWAVVAGIRNPSSIRQRGKAIVQVDEAELED